MKALLNETEDKMKKSVARLEHEFTTIRAGRANPAVLEPVVVDYYGVPTPIQQMAAVSVSEARILVIQPWDASTLKAIEKAILASDIGITPTNDGKVLRLAFPQPTEDRRKELCKSIKKLGEEAKVAVRNVRRDSIEKLKAKKKASPSVSLTVTNPAISMLSLKKGETFQLKVKVTPKKKAKEKKPKSEGEEAKQKKKPSLPKPTKEELRDLITTALSALKETAKRTCKRLRIDPLEILVVFGGTDPADIAQTYGYASAAMWGVMPHLEDLFHIPDPSLHLRMDYSSEKTHAEGAVGLSLRIRDGLHIALALLIPMLKWYLRYKKAHKNDAPAEKPTESTPQNSEHSEKLTA